MHRIIPAIALAYALLAPGAAAAHEGPSLDENGCHYERPPRAGYHCHRDVPPNIDRNPPVKKGRDNLCYDRTSRMYAMVRYFISYRSMDECLVSGGREAL
jgi:hypothetical protein